MNSDRHFLARLREATRLLQTAGPAAATAAIQRVLQGAKAPVAETNAGGSPSMPRVDMLAAANPTTENNANAAPESATGRAGGVRKPFWRSWKGTSARQPVERAYVEVDVEDKGEFLTASCTNHAGTRAYQVYVPSSYRAQELPLIVMLHGCKQNPNDFAAGTGMNTVAEQNNCFVVYPAQAFAANGSNCWNWFKADDQQRDRGEPSIIADITREAIRKYHIDASRVYVAGLSAGGAMAAIMGAAYPELYGAVGIHSGLPVGAAHDLPSAFAAMKNGARTVAPHQARGKATPVIVFHGDRDKTVHPSNGDQVLAQCIEQSKAGVTVENGKVPNGRTYTRTVRHDGHGKAIAEQWVIHGADHAWSGGSIKGSYTDPTGPNASKEMFRFFQTHRRSQR